MTLRYGQITGHVSVASTDVSDNPPARVPAVGRLVFTRVGGYVLDADAEDPEAIVLHPQPYGLDGNGRLVDGNGNDGVQLYAGRWTVRFELQNADLPPATFLLPAGVSLDLAQIMPGASGQVLIGDNTLIGLDTDGTPYFDPDGVTTAALLGLDVDGVLFVAH